MIDKILQAFKAPFLTCSFIILGGLPYYHMLISTIALIIAKMQLIYKNS